jgi:uncharacterized membrane protein HdeD (DUF308 family)
MKMRSLVANWWMMAMRGVLAIAFGVAVYVWPDVTLSVIVVLFGLYALLDGVWAVAAGVRASTRVLDAWPVVLEGVVSIVLGLVALLWPTIPRPLIWLVATWGALTGILELITALGEPSGRPRRWLLLTGGASSLFLALVIVALPYASAGLVARVISAYAQVFGVVLLFAAVDFPRRRSIAAAAPWPP